QESLAEFHAATAIDTVVYPPDSMQTAQSLTSEGVELRKLRRADEARELGERALAMLRARPRDNQRDPETVLLNLGDTYTDLRRLDHALHASGEALDIAQRLFGPDHVSVAEIMTPMARAESRSGHRDRARDHWKRATEIYSAHDGPDTPQVANVMAYIA